MAAVDCTLSQSRVARRLLGMLQIITSSLASEYEERCYLFDRSFLRSSIVERCYLDVGGVYRGCILEPQTFSTGGKELPNHRNCGSDVCLLNILVVMRNASRVMLARRWMEKMCCLKKKSRLSGSSIICVKKKGPSWGFDYSCRRET